MKELLPVVSDDLDWHENQVRNPAQKEMSVGFMGVWYNLDLTTAHAREVAEFMHRYAVAGTRTSKPHRAARPGADADRRAFLVRFRAWCDRQGIELEKRPSGGYKYPDKLLRQFEQEEHEAGRVILEAASNGLGSDRPVRHGADAGDRVRSG